MKKTDELKKAISDKRDKLISLKNEAETEEDYKTLKAVSEELKKLLEKYEVEKTLEETEAKNFLKTAKPLAGISMDDAARLRNRAFNKLVLNPLRGEFRIPLTEEEKTAYFNVTGSPGQPAQIEAISESGGYLVPQEQMAQFQEFRKEFVALKEYVSVVSTTSSSGRWATYRPQDLEFQKFAEMSDIPEGDVKFGEQKYVIEDRGLILPVSNQLVSDANIDIISFLGRQLAEGAVGSENREILKPLKGLLEESPTMTSYKALNTAMFKTLDGAYEKSAKIFTNQDGFLWLSNLEDGQNRPLLLPDVTEPSKYYYRGKEIVVIPNSTLENATISSHTYAPFFVGDMKSCITLFERQGMELATSSELYFKKYGMALRAVIRFGVVLTDAEAVTALKVEV